MSAVMKLNLPQPTLHVTGILITTHMSRSPVSLTTFISYTRPSATAAAAVDGKNHPSCDLQGFYDLSCKTTTPLPSLTNNQSH